MFSFRKIGKCALIWDGFCFGFDHVLSRFYLRERIHIPVRVMQSSWKDKQMAFEWKYLRNNIYAYSFVFAHSQQKYDHEATESKLHLNDWCLNSWF